MLEIGFQDIGFAVVYVLLLLLVAFRVGRLVLERPSRRAESVAILGYQGVRLRLAVFFVASFILWEVLFSIYRYLSPLELLAPVLVAILVSSLTRLDYFRAVLLAVLFAAISLSMYTANWGRLPWSSSYFPVSVPHIESDALVIMTTGQPFGYLVPYFPQSVQFVRVQSNFDGIATAKWAGEEASVIANRVGPTYLLTPDGDEAQENAALKPYGYAVVFGTCSVVSSAIAVSPSSFPDVYLCQLRPATAPPAG